MAVMKAREILLCADDYGIAPGVGSAIRTLARHGRLSATSCMTVTDFWREEAARLAEDAGELQVGLHFTLTQAKPLGRMRRLAPEGRLPSPGTLARNALQGKLPLGEIEEELERQIDEFVAAYGRLPQFLDGHHHVHQLPGVRDVVLNVHGRRLAEAGAWIRCCWDSPVRILARGVTPIKAFSIALFGLPLRRAARKRGLAVNAGFTGVYDYVRPRPMGELMERFLTFSTDGTLIMCHPGIADEALSRADTLVSRREEEYRYFMSDEFTQQLARLNVSLTTKPSPSRSEDCAGT